jgi:hypothetical protein
MLVIWKLRARPRRLIWNGVRPSMRWPLSRISPLLGPKRPLMRLNSVDLPAPFGPMIATRSPGATASSVPRMISVLPNRL